MLSIRVILDQLLAGRIRVPAFQRGFVWDMERVAYFMDSLYKGYPFGSLLFWRTRNRLIYERDLGPYRLPELDPALPIDYVLDGQQRITSIFAVFQTSLPRPTHADWLNVFFDLKAEPDVQDSQFFALADADADPERFFPLNCLFDSVAYRQATEPLHDEEKTLIDNLQAQFKEVLIPVQSLETEDRTRVAIVFERVNRLGVELDTLQLLTAWTWSEEFDLQQKFTQLSEELSDYGFSQIGEDSNLVLRCCAAVITENPSAESLIRLNGAEVRDKFQLVENGIRGAIDFLQKQLNVETLHNLPYPALLVPLSVFFADYDERQVRYNDAAATTLRRWFWRACFSRRYSGQTTRASRVDSVEMRKLREDDPTCALGDFVHDIDAEFFTGSQFRMAAANTKTFVLLLANGAPLSFLSGNAINLRAALQAYNRAEFHHLFPRAFLKGRDVEDALANALVNIAMVSRTDNNQIGSRAPSEYRQLMPADQARVDEVLAHALTPDELFSDDYDAFMARRIEILVAKARDLMA